MKDQSALPVWRAMSTDGLNERHVVKRRPLPPRTHLSLTISAMPEGGLLPKIGPILSILQPCFGQHGDGELSTIHRSPIQLMAKLGGGGAQWKLR